MICTARQQWLALVQVFPTGWFSVVELSKATGFGKSRVMHGIVYARSRGFVEEQIERRVRARADGHHQTYLRSSYRLKIGTERG
jgi:hypothetical protein